MLTWKVAVIKTANLFPFKLNKQSISRVLFHPQADGDNHLSRHGSCLPAQATQPGRFRGPHHPFPIWSCSVWGLPKPASHLTAGALLPHLSTLTRKSGGLNLYGTIPKVTLAGRYPAHCPMEPGLSSSGVMHQPRLSWQLISTSVIITYLRCSCQIRC